MVTVLHLTLLGRPQARLDDEPLVFQTAKAEALLYYLAVTGQPQPRASLVELLWGEMPETKARRNLTATLTSLRKHLAPYLVVEPDKVAFNQAAPHQLDVALFLNQIEAGRESGEIYPLQEAVGLYRGDFLEGLAVKKALSFEEWALTQQERLRDLAIGALDRLVTEALHRNDLAVGIKQARRLLTLEPWRESAHRQMMWLLVRSGQRSAALAQYETCRRVLAEELGVEPTPETMALYERLKVAGTPPPHNLPSQPNAFMGRVREMNQLATHLNNPDCRLLTLVGLGGIGKTRLAIEGSRRYIQPDQALGGATFSEGIYFVNLASISLTGMTEGETSRLRQISNLVASAIADSLEFSFHGPTDLMVQLLNHLREKEMLLILDNFEHLVEKAGLLAELLQRTSRLKLLVTSRERLNLMEEWVMEIEGLEFPKPFPLPEGGLAWKSDLENYGAVALFVRQAQQVQADFTPAKAEIPHIVRLCQLVEGIPLALVLAASWLRVLTCAEIVQEIEQNLDFLTATQRNIPQRHRSLRAVFDQSWQMLSEPEQNVFKQLSIFRGGFRREAAGEVVGASLAMLADLVDKSLLRLTSSGRYEIHELLRQFAAEKLAQVTAEEEAAHQAHCRYYARFLQAQDWLLEDVQWTTKAEIVAEIDNIRAGWQWAIAPGRALAVTEISQYAWSLRLFYAWRGSIQEGLEVFGQAMVRLEEEKSFATFNTAQNLAYGQVLSSYGIFHHLLGDIPQALEFFRKSLLAFQCSDATSRVAQREHALALHQYGMASIWQGHYTDAEQSFRRSQLRFKAISDRLFESRSMVMQAIVAYELGNYVKAEQLLEEYLSIFKALGEFWYAVEALSCLARVKYALGKPLSRVEKRLRENLQMARDWGNTTFIVHTLKFLGIALSLMGPEKQVEARQTLEECLALSREEQAGLNTAPALYQLAVTNSALGDDNAATTCFYEALEIVRTFHLYPMMLGIFVGIATLWLKQQPLTSKLQEQVLTLLTLALTHPASNRQTQDKAARLLAEFGPDKLPLEIITAAKERAQTMTLEAMAQEILNESNEST